MRKALLRFAQLTLCLSAALLALKVLFPLPDISGRTDTFGRPADESTKLGRFLYAQQTQQPQGLTGVSALQSNEDALISRLVLIDEAEASVDVQYYIWHDDVSGLILLDALDRAAKRGVRVRLLLDDNGVPGMDAMLATLNAQEAFEVRLYNPSTVRTPKLLGYGFDFFRMNRRMHNKALIVDGAATIIGGRNIGDEYFQVNVEDFFFDLDVLAVGKAAQATQKIFDSYWNSQSAFEVERIITAQVDRAAFEERVAGVRQLPDVQEIYSKSAAAGSITSGVFGPLEWTRVAVVADNPIKGQGIAKDEDLMVHQLGKILGGVENNLYLASAYFVPGSKGAEFFAGLAEDGVNVEVLTNALDTTDVFLVHAGYSRYRRELLEAGIELYELKSRGAASQDEEFQVLPFGLSGASLHAKTFAVDGKRVFIGSFNFDPRSALLNTEMGFLIDSSEMAANMTRLFQGPVRLASYQPKLTPNGKMMWLDEKPNGGLVTYQEEPGASWMMQIVFALIGLLPVEWLL